MGKRHLQLTANVLCCVRLMGFLWTIRQHDGSVGTREVVLELCRVSTRTGVHSHALHHAHTHTDGCISSTNT